MKSRLFYIPIVFLLLLSFADCAKKGSPTGGLRDSIPPVIVKSSPENFSVNFTESEIRIYFDEYIKLKDLQKNLIISPPMKYSPIITPLGTSKYIKIKIIDTLKENTTYSLNFGQSIVDNNEENPFNYFKYVFSTGSYIDSLKLSGTVTDAQLLHTPVPTSVMLYEVNDEFKDSLIYSEKPTYITTTRDSTSTFELSNLKAGKYLLLALNESNNDYIFQPKRDKIAFVRDYIELPTDSSYVLSLFKEIPAYRVSRPSLQSKHEIIFGYEGEIDDFSLSTLSTMPDGFESKIYKDLKKDTLHYWFKPAIEKDSILFLAQKNNQIDTLNVRMKSLFADSLTVTNLSSGTLTPKDTLSLKINTPIVAIDNEKIRVMDKDSISVNAQGVVYTAYNVAKIVFEIKEEQYYSIQLLPGALTDFFEATNDTLNYTLRSKASADYGTLDFSVENVKEYPIIVQLVNDKFKVVSETYLTNARSVFFDFIPSGIYYVRIIFDENENGKWDTGNFLQRLQPEKVIYYPAQLEIRANWKASETFTLD